MSLVNFSQLSWKSA